MIPLPPMAWDVPVLADLVRREHAAELTGHGFDHLDRTLGLALEIAGRQPAPVDYDVLVAAVLLHDIAFPSGGTKDHARRGAAMAPGLLARVNFPPAKIPVVCQCILHHAGQIDPALNETSALPIEGVILIDADNLDALGAVGVARMAAFCAAHGIPPFVRGDADGFNDSLYGGLKVVRTWAAGLRTGFARELARERVAFLDRYLAELAAEHSRRT